MNDKTEGVNYRTVVLVALLAAALSIALSLARGDRLRHLDEFTYDRLATSLVEGGGYSHKDGAPTSFRPPGYPIFIAGVYKLWHSPHSVKLAQGLMIGLIAGMVGVFSERVKAGSGWMAAALTALYPLLLYTSTTLYPQTLATTLMLAVFLAGFGHFSLWRAGLAGLIYGYLMLTVPFYLLLLPFAALALAWGARGIGTSLRRCWVALCFCIAAGAVVAPWTLRNYMVFEQFIPISTNGGVNLLAGNSPDAGANTGIMAYQRYIPATQGMTEYERDSYFKEQALAWIAEDPARAARLYVMKLANYFNFENKVVAKGENPGLLGSAALFLSYYLLLALVVARLLSRRQPLSALEKVFLAGYVVNGLISALFYTRLRYRLPFDVTLFVPAAVMVANWIQYHSRAKRTDA